MCGNAHACARAPTHMGTGRQAGKGACQGHAAVRSGLGQPVSAVPGPARAQAVRVDTSRVSQILLPQARLGSGQFQTKTQDLCQGLQPVPGHCLCNVSVLGAWGQPQSCLTANTAWWGPALPVGSGG